MSAVSRACAARAEVMPGAQAAAAEPRQRRHADDLADLGAVDVDRLVRSHRDRLAVLDRHHHHGPAGWRSARAARPSGRGPRARCPRGPSLDVARAARVGEGGGGHPLVARELRVVRADRA